MAVTGTQEPLWFTASNWDADFHQIVERMVSTPLEQLLREGEAMGLGASDLDRLRRKKLLIAGLSVEKARAVLGESREIGLRQITTTLSMVRALRQIEAIYDGSLERRDSSGGQVIQAAPPDNEVARWVGISILRTRNLLIGSSQLLLSYPSELRDPALVGMFQDAVRLLPKLGPRLKLAIKTHALPPRPVAGAGQNAIEPLSLAVRIAEAGWSSICQARDPMSAALAIERELNCTKPPVRESEPFTGDEWFAGRMDSILRAVGEWPSIDYSGLIAMVEAYCLEAFASNGASGQEADYEFRQDGDFWYVRYEREKNTVKHSVGMLYIRRILELRKTLINAEDLAFEGGVPASGRVSADEGQKTNAEGRMPAFDKWSIDDLEKGRDAALALAESEQDPARQMIHRERAAQIEGHLAAGRDNKGKPRRGRSEAEKMASTVATAIRRTVEHLDSKGLKRLALFLGTIKQNGAQIEFSPPAKHPWKLS